MWRNKSKEHTGWNLETNNRMGDYFSFSNVFCLLSWYPNRFHFGFVSRSKDKIIKTMFCTIEACVSPKRLENLQCELIFCSFYLSFLKRKNVCIPESAIHCLSVLCNSSQCRKMFKIITSKWSRGTLYNTPRICFFLFHIQCSILTFLYLDR